MQVGADGADVANAAAVGQRRIFNSIHLSESGFSEAEVCTQCGGADSSMLPGSVDAQNSKIPPQANKAHSLRVAVLEIAAKGVPDIEPNANVNLLHANDLKELLVVGKVRRGPGKH